MISKMCLDTYFPCKRKNIVKDLNYIPKDSANGYHEFIQNMHSALVGGRKITRKMESSIAKIITTYNFIFALFFRFIF